MSKLFDKKMEVCGFENLHNHSSYSLLDGVSEVEHAALKTKENNQQYLCFSDHGSLGSIPRAIRAAEKVGLTNIFSSELYVNDCRVPPEEIKNLPDEDRQEASTSYHLLAIAYNNTGYRNLVQLSSLAWLKGFYRKPRVNHQQLIDHREGIFFTSCCCNSEIARAFLDKGEEAADQMLE